MADDSFQLKNSSPPSLPEALQRIKVLEARIAESEETLDAIGRGDVDAVVTKGADGVHRIYTLENADTPYQALIEQIQEGAITLGVDGTVLYCNRRMAAILDSPQERVIGQMLQFFLRPDERPAFAHLLAEASLRPARSEFLVGTSSLNKTPVYVSLSRLPSSGTQHLLCGVVGDLSQHKLHLHELSEANAGLLAASAQRDVAEDALRQSQKMEAVGQLTGGLAHDFNNLLTGITGSLSLLRTRVAQGRYDALDRYLDAAQGASDRATALTHRLLAFSRQQILAAAATDTNALAEGLEEMVRRTVGPGIRFETSYAPDLWTTLCDPHQLENALLNLCINARDAMPDGGCLKIDTVNARLEGSLAVERDLTPGDYVEIRVSDTGVGMTPEVMAHVFEPFFTTKPLGQGTGLGLSMIYGFAKQTGGQVRVQSTVDVGTTMRLYLPRFAGEAEPAQRTMAPFATGRSEAGETVLVVDDDPTVRMLVLEVLQELGYRTLEASDGPVGLDILRSDTRIDLMVTDVGLPGGMNGRQVADAGRALRPGLKVLYMTGYAESVVMGSDEMDSGIYVLTKPFAMGALTTRIREIIKGGVGD